MNASARKLYNNGRVELQSREVGPGSRSCKSEHSAKAEKSLVSSKGGASRSKDERAATENYLLRHIE